MADIVKQGYVKFQGKSLGNLGVWNKKWLMLRRRSAKGPLRLEKYKDEQKAGVMSEYGAAKRIIDLTRVDRIERVPESVRKHAVCIHVDASLALQFSVNSEMEAESWLNAIRDEMHPENRQNPESFPVYLLPSERLSISGDCSLQLTRDSVRILDSYGSRELVRWPLTGLRKYGVDRSMLTIETGSSCPSGEGTFTLSCDDADYIYHRMQTLIQALSSSSSSSSSAASQSTGSQFSESNWGNLLSIHELSNQRAAAAAAAASGGRGGAGGSGGGGGGGGGRNQAADTENAYHLDMEFPTTGRSSLNRSNHMPESSSLSPLSSSSSSSSQAATTSAMTYDHYDLIGPPLSDLQLANPPPAATSSSSTSRSNYPAYNRAATSNTTNATEPLTGGAAQVVAVGGPYYAVTRPKNTNLSANQRDRNAATGQPTNGGQVPTSDERVRAAQVDGAYYAVPRPTTAEGSNQTTPPSHPAGRAPRNEARLNNGQLRSELAPSGGERAVGENSQFYVSSQSYDATAEGGNGYYAISNTRGQGGGGGQRPS